MPLVINDEQLRSMKMDELEARVEIACRLFQAGKLDLWPASELAGISRPEMEAELRSRRIAVYTPTSEDFEEDVATLAEFRRARASR